MTKEDLEKLSAGELAREIIAQEFAYRDIRMQFSRPGIVSSIILDRLAPTYEATLKALYEELDKREKKT